jgi:sulfur relay (sulfurtransferase) DsrF/TusC family protein
VKRRVLFIVTNDPRISPRPAEAVRIAAGVGAWEKIEAVLYLRGAAVLALGEHAEELVDGDHFVDFLPLAAEGGRRICAQRSSPLLAEVGEAQTAFETLDDDQLAQLASDSDCVVRF